jgi:hypothetical protein
VAHNRKKEKKSAAPYSELAQLHSGDSEISRSSETESPPAPLTQGSKKTVCNASSLIVIVVLSIAALFMGNIHKR